MATQARNPLTARRALGDKSPIYCTATFELKIDSCDDSMKDGNSIKDDTSSDKFFNPLRKDPIAESGLDANHHQAHATLTYHQCAPLANKIIERRILYRTTKWDQLASLSDNKIKELFFVPDVAYREVPGKDTVHAAWQNYLDANGYSSAFLPLRGTERDRYLPIIKEVTQKDNLTRVSADPALEEIAKVREAMKDLPDIDSQALAAGSPELRERKLLNEKLRILERSYELLSKFASHTKRHFRQHPEFLKTNHRTPFGNLKACRQLPKKHWYVGHRPGDPIVRLRRDCVPAPDFCEGGMFFVREVPGNEDEEEGWLYLIRTEGVVPFNGTELNRRFTGWVFPVFERMVIAFLGFDPQDTDHGAHPWAKWMERIQALNLDERSEQERAGKTKLWRRIWRIKYGTDCKKYPTFLEEQIAQSISVLREMGWLMNRLELIAPQHASHHYWNHCKGLLEEITGRDISLLAQEHFAITLSDEAIKRLEDNDVENILIYRQNKQSRHTAKVSVIFATVVWFALILGLLNREGSEKEPSFSFPFSFAFVVFVSFFVFLIYV